MPDESRVKPQPYRAEELKALSEWLALGPNFTLSAHEQRRLIATIEEARREQPVRNDALADECAKASYETYDDGQDDYSDLFRRAAKALRDPHPVSLPANARREQPVRVTEPAWMKELRRMDDERARNELAVLADRAFWSATLALKEGEPALKAMRFTIDAIIASALAAAPKEGEDG